MVIATDEIFGIHTTGTTRVLAVDHIISVLIGYNASNSGD